MSDHVPPRGEPQPEERHRQAAKRYCNKEWLPETYHLDPLALAFAEFERPLLEALELAYEWLGEAHDYECKYVAKGEFWCVCGLLEVVLKVRDTIPSLRVGTAEPTHACPPNGEGLTPCCGKTPFELPSTDRLTEDSALVTCALRVGRPAPAEQEEEPNGSR